MRAARQRCAHIGQTSELLNGVCVAVYADVFAAASNVGGDSLQTRHRQIALAAYGGGVYLGDDTALCAQFKRAANVVEIFYVVGVPFAKGVNVPEYVEIAVGYHLPYATVVGAFVLAAISYARQHDGVVYRTDEHIGAQGTQKRRFLGVQVRLAHFVALKQQHFALELLFYALELPQSLVERERRESVARAVDVYVVGETHRVKTQLHRAQGVLLHRYGTVGTEICVYVQIAFELFHNFYYKSSPQICKQKRSTLVGDYIILKYKETT